jgi:excisionase family DNA binding protein
MKTHELKQTLERLDERIAFTPEEVAKIFNVDRGIVYRRIAGKKILALRIGSSYIIPWFSLARLWGSDPVALESFWGKRSSLMWTVLVTGSRSGDVPLVGRGS